MPVTTETVTYDDMIIGTFPVMTRKVTINSGAGELKRGVVLGQISTGGKYTTALDASSDGSETPKYILAENVDATSADVVADVYVTGEFNASKLTFGTGVTAADFEAANLDAERNLFVREPV